MSELAGKVIILTGASRGIGAAAAIELAALGAKLSISSRSAEACDDVLKTIKNAGGEAFAANCDVSDYEDVDKLVLDTLARYGKIDTLINNAGIVDPIGTIENSDPEDWARNISVNLVGV
ncbi:MAG: SDR family NAD(P)-dependent oxidoreductase, partial [Sneathiella sp.]|nr:SDR family NAD(P)-dependent oxidoreductase [Sneathiella sp.]